MVDAERDEAGDELRGDTGSRGVARAGQTWTKSRRRMLANGRTWTSWSSVRGVVDARDAADRDARRVQRRDAVRARLRAGGDRRVCPGVTSSLRVVKRISEVVRAPGLDLDHAADAALGHARADGGACGR